IILLLTGCGKKVEYDPNNFLETGDKIVKEKITIRMFAPLHSLHSREGYNAMRLFKEMEEITNIHIEWSLAPVQSYDEIRATQWQSKNKVDAFFLYNSLEDVVRYGQNGTIYELTDYIDKYAPNYNSILEANPSYRTEATFNGKMYSMLSINDVPRDQTFKQFINKKWLDNLGLDVPTTTEEYYEVLKAFKNGDPNGNGIPDEIPLSSASLKQTRNFLMSAFGYVSTGLEVNDDIVQFVAKTENYQEYLKYTNKLYAEHLLDNNTYAMTESDLAGKGSLVGSFDGAAGYLIAGESRDADYIALPPLTSPFNNQQMWLGFQNVNPSAIIIPKTSPYVKELIRWMDFLYSPLGIELQSFGKAGEDFTWDDEGHTSFTFNVPKGMNIEEFRGGITPAVGLGVVAYFSKEIALKDNNIYTQRINKQVDDAHYLDYLKIPLPILTFTNPENTQLAIIKTDLDIYMAVIEQKFVTGQLALNPKNWQDHLDNLTKLKVNDLLNIYQTAYNRRRDSL
ncbi:MAG: extracellular solute-binding protein, partial [Bacillales bacterium]|nr:extracellular solute-binding protein [Bacillales bacterium]